LHLCNTGTMAENPGIWRTNDPGSLGYAVGQLRRAKGMTQEELASWVGLNRQYVGLLESGGLGIQLQRVYDVLGILGYDIVLAPRRAMLTTVSDPADEQ
jgi:HTH-type transcriptional regulator/antitoxin HipB